MILPLRDIIVIDPLPGAGMVGLIHIPETGNSRNQTHHYAMVVAAGPTAEVRAGAKVLCSDLFGVAIEHEGQKYRIGRSRDIVGVVEEVAFHAPPLA